MPRKKKSKTKTKEGTEESEIEEEVQEAEKEINFEEITENNVGGMTEFLTHTESKAPVLERIASQTQIQIPIELQKEITEEKRINYSSNEPQYNTAKEETEEKNYETAFIPPVLSTRRTSEQNNFFIPRENTWGEAGQIRETPEQFETMEGIQGRLPFEEEQKKYKKVKF